MLVDKQELLLNDLLESMELQEAPHTVRLAGIQYIGTVGIGKDHTATIIIHSDDLKMLHDRRDVECK